MPKKFVATIGAAMVTIGAPAVFASSALTVSVGGDTSDRDHSFTATTRNGVEFRVTNANSEEIEMGCQSVTIEGVVHGGSTTTNNSNSMHHVASITGSSWEGCIGVSEIPMNATPDHISPWEIHVSHGSSVTSGSSDLIGGQVTGVDISFSDGLTNGALCGFDFAGTMIVSVSESTQELTIDSNSLEVDHMSSCFGAFADGDPVELETVFDLMIDQPSSGPILIS